LQLLGHFLQVIKSAFFTLQSASEDVRVALHLARAVFMSAEFVFWLSRHASLQELPALPLAQLLLQDFISNFGGELSLHVL
jgi:hypothetical protein